MRDEEPFFWVTRGVDEPPSQDDQAAMARECQWALQSLLHASTANSEWHKDGCTGHTSIEHTSASGLLYYGCWTHRGGCCVLTASNRFRISC